MWKKFIILIVGMASVGIASILIKLCEAPPVVISTYRMSVSALMFLPLFILQKNKQMDTKTVNFLPLGILIAIHFILWMTSLEFTTVLSSTVLVTTNPIFVPIISWLLFKEKTKRSVIFAIILSFAGSVFIAMASGSQGPGQNFGNLLALLGAIAVSFYLVLGKKVREKSDLITFTFLVNAFASILLITISILTGQKLFNYSKTTYLYFFLIALFPQVIGHTIFNWALRFFSPSFVALSILGEPVFATIFAFIILKEVPVTSELIGSIFILTGIYVAARTENVKSPSEEGQNLKEEKLPKN